MTHFATDAASPNAQTGADIPSISSMSIDRPLGDGGILHLIFDFDGTLVDSVGALGDALASFLDYTGVVYDRQQTVRAVMPLGFDGVARYLNEHFHLSITPQDITQRVGDSIYIAYRDTIPAKVGVIDTLTALRGQGYHLHILTASPHLTVDACMRRLGLDALFEHAWSTDDFGCNKSEVRLFHTVAQTLGVHTRDCLFFDDNIKAVTVAGQAGMIACGVYDEASASVECQMREVCDGRYLRTMDELPALLRSLI